MGGEGLVTGEEAGKVNWDQIMKPSECHRLSSVEQWEAGDFSATKISI